MKKKKYLFSFIINRNKKKYWLGLVIICSAPYAVIISLVYPEVETKELLLVIIFLGLLSAMFIDYLLQKIK